MSIWPLLFRVMTFAWMLSPISAYADEFDTRQLFRSGDWVVAATSDLTDGGRWCTASTTNRRAQSLSLTGFESGGLALIVYDERWQLYRRAIRFLVEIDYNSWTIDGQGEDQGVSVLMNDAAAAGRFVAQLAAGNAVAISNQDGRRLASFSLHGSRAALNTLMDCWRLIVSRDPFATQSDPF